MQYHRRAKRIAFYILSIFLFTVTAQASQIQEVIPIGRTAGIKLTADGVMVVRLSDIQTQQGKICPAKQAGLREGDMILTADGKAIDSNEALKQAVAAAKNDTLMLDIRRSGTAQKLEIRPVMDLSGEKRIGVMVRDSIAGIGTITYVNPENGEYGSLGHGICDAELGILLPLSQGSIMEASVTQVQKGKAGEPGALQGEFNLQQDMGSVTENTATGIFGKFTDDSYYHSLPTVKVAQESEIQVGQAQILSNIHGEESKLYTVEIEKIFDDSDDLGRGMLLHVTDQELLEQTGGIVQGMSGSPVMQNGKLVGAVTHVLVNDPTRGYAVFINKMLDEMEN